MICRKHGIRRTAGSKVSYCRGCLNALALLKKVLEDAYLIDRGPWYIWAFEALTGI